MENREWFEKLANEDLQQVAGGIVTEDGASWMNYYISVLKQLKASHKTAVEFFSFKFSYGRNPVPGMTKEEALEYLEEHWNDQ